jgi:hypothetical protein
LRRRISAEQNLEDLLDAGPSQPPDAKLHLENVVAVFCDPETRAEIDRFRGPPIPAAIGMHPTRVVWLDTALRSRISKLLSSWIYDV